ILGVYEPPANLAWAEAWARTEGLLAHLSRRVTRSGAAFGVAVSPACLEYDPRMRWIVGRIPPARARGLDYDYPHRRLADFLTRHGIPWVSLLPSLRAYYAATERSGCYDWDGHWDPEGHRVAAGVLKEFLQRLLHRG